jgi:bacterioferritin-associated ferredoxin
MIVCICHRVSDRDIARAARDGCPSFDDLQIDTGVGTCCGKCHDSARQTFELHAAAAAAPADASVCFAHPAQQGITMAMPQTLRHTATRAAAAD